MAISQELCPGYALCFPQGEFPRQNPEGSKSTNTSRVRHNPSRTVARVDGADHIYSLPSMAAKRFQADSAAARFTFMNGRFFAPSLMARFRAILLVHAAATAINLDQRLSPSRKSQIPPAGDM